MLQILGKARWLLALFLALELLGSGLGAVEPAYLQAFMSAVIDTLGSQQAAPSSSIGSILGIMALIHLGAAACLGLSTYLMAIVSSGVLKDLRSLFFSKMSRLPIAYFREVNQGEFVTQFNMDISHAERFLSETIPQVVLNVFMGAAVFVILLITCSPLLTLLGLGVAVLSSLLVLWLNRLLEQLSESLRDSYADINRVFDETVQGIDTLKVFGGEGMQAQKFDHYNEMFRSLSLASGRLASLFLPFIDLTLKLGNLAILAIVYLMIGRGTLDRDAFLRFFLYLVMFQSHINGVIGVLSNIQPTLVSLRRLQGLFGQAEEAVATPAAPFTTPRALSLEIRELDFAWPSGHTVFAGASLSLADRRALHLQGASGAGKTTLINLLLRFYEPPPGQILINGTDVLDLPLDSLRAMVSVVTQDHFVFEESLRENLALARPRASDEEMCQALAKANLEDWLHRLPEGLDTIMSTRGKTISGGERQRLCLARAFLKQAPLVVLDEPFANVDSGTRHELLKAIMNLRQEATLLLISHQPVEEGVVDERWTLDSREKKFVRCHNFSTQGTEETPRAL